MISNDPILCLNLLQFEHVIVVGLIRMDAEQDQLIGRVWLLGAMVL
jgi:hypothetical protein